MANILIVDDNSINREFLAMLLGYGGHRVEEAVDGAAALAALRRSRPDLVICDIVMPVMDGVEFALQVQGEPELSAIPIIFYTAAYRQAEARQLPGVAAVITKPSKPQTILDTVASVLGQMPAPARQAPEPRLPTADAPALSLRLATLLEVGLSLAAQRDPQQLLDMACRAAAQLVGAKCAILRFIAGESQDAGRLAVCGCAEAEALAATSQQAGMFDEVLSGGSPLRVGAAERPDLSPCSLSAAARLVVPLKSATRSCGWLYLACPLNAEAFGDDDEQIATALAAQVTLAYENLVQFEALRAFAARLQFDSAERFYQSFQHAPIGKAIAGLDGSIQRANPALCRLLGYSEAELCAKTVADVTAAEDMAREFPLIERLVAGEIDHYELEKRDIHKAGHPVWVQVTVALVRDAASIPLYFIAQIQDIGERRRLEAERAAHLERITDLSHRVVAAQETERRHLANMVHDLVSPNLAALRINLGIMSARLPRAILRDVDSMLADTWALLDDANATLRTMVADLHPVVMDYSGLLPALDSYAHQFGSRCGIRIHVRGDENAPRLPMDVEIVLFRIVQEALAHCVRHVAATTVTVDLQHDARHACLSVLYDGIGFEPAVDGRLPTGLHIMRERAEFAGGTFHVASRPGEGTCLTVRI